RTRTERTAKGDVPRLRQGLENGFISAAEPHHIMSNASGEAHR
ncbi:Os09g0294550, partial [Oryza sativa Japonica Group]